MRAADIMTMSVVTVTPETPVKEAARLMLAHHVSALPVVDGLGHVIGMVSEGDLQRRAEIATERRRSWWLELLTSNTDRAREFEREAGRHVRNVMTRDPVTVSEDTSVGTIASLLETRHIKRVPVLREERLVGIVSRADLLRGIAASPQAPEPPSLDDQALRKAVLDALGGQKWISVSPAQVVVSNGAVHLWGHAISLEEAEAMTVVAENVPGVRDVFNHMVVVPMASFQPLGMF